MKSIRVSGAIFGVIILAVLVLDGCSVFMAAKQPDKKNLDVLTVGVPRKLVLAELGNPISTVVKDDKRTDIFSFVQGYSKGAKVSRAVFHGAADVFTLGLWEVVGTPAEAVFDGDKMAFEVQYDSGDKVAKVTQLVGPDTPTSVPKVVTEKAEAQPMSPEKVEAQPAATEKVKIPDQALPVKAEKVELPAQAQPMMPEKAEVPVQAQPMKP